VEKNDGGGGREPVEYEEVYHTHVTMYNANSKQGKIFVSSRTRKRCIITS